MLRAKTACSYLLSTLFIITVSLSFTIAIDVVFVEEAFALTEAECAAMLNKDKKKKKKEEEEDKKKKDTPEEQQKESDKKQTEEHEDAMGEGEDSGGGSATAAEMALCQRLMDAGFAETEQAMQSMLKAAKEAGASPEQLARMEENAKSFRERMVNWGEKYEQEHPQSNDKFLKENLAKTTRTYENLEKIANHEGQNIFEKNGSKLTRAEIMDEFLAQAGAPAVSYVDQGPNPSCFTCSFEKFGYYVHPDKTADFVEQVTNNYSESGKTAFYTNHEGKKAKIPYSAIAPGRGENFFDVATMTENGARGPVGRIIEHGMLTGFYNANDRGYGEWKNWIVGNKVYTSQGGTWDGEIQSTSKFVFDEFIPDSGDFRSVAAMKASIANGETPLITHQARGHAWTFNADYRLNSDGTVDVYAINDNQWGEGRERIVPLADANLTTGGMPGGGGPTGPSNPGGGGGFNPGGGGGGGGGGPGGGGGGGGLQPGGQNNPYGVPQRDQNGNYPTPWQAPGTTPQDQNGNSWPTPWEKPADTNSNNDSNTNAGGDGDGDGDGDGSGDGDSMALEEKFKSLSPFERREYVLARLREYDERLSAASSEAEMLEVETELNQFIYELNVYRRRLVTEHYSRGLPPQDSSTTDMPELAPDSEEMGEHVF